MVLINGIFDGLDVDREHLVILALNPNFYEIGHRVVASGTHKTLRIEPQIVIQDAVRLGAHGIVVAHNHPSGRGGKSKADVSFGKQLRRLAGLIGIKIYDEIIVRSGLATPRSERLWTDDEVEKLVQWVEEKTSVPRIARLLRRSRAEIEAKADELAVPVPGQKRYQ